MPLYDYVAKDPERACDHCRAGFECMHGLNERGPTKCPKCGAPVKRAISVPNVSGGRWSSKRLLNKDHIHKHGFKTGTDLLESGDVKL
jgi:putative FmdB family regulatory protein